ncbi:MAG: hypothetical protein QOG10_1073 [Kribbellaceae bacterium]|nr:hypothetical protein [Kribbellaceae bacterium]
MSVRVTSDPAEFAATVFPFLEKDPVLNTVLLSNVQDRATGLLTEEWSSRFGREYEQTRGSRLHKLELGRCGYGSRKGSRSAWSVTRPPSSVRPGSVRSTHLQSTGGTATPAH